MIEKWLNLLFGKRAPLPGLPLDEFPGWQERITRAVSHESNQRIYPQQAVRRLHLMPASRLANLDQSVRVHLSTNVHQAHSLPQAESDAVAHLFIQGCERSGYTRQSALQAFHRYPGRLATALALIRCDDWVPQVRHEARNLLATIIKNEGAAPLFELGGLLLALRDRQRIQAHIWPELIEPALRHTDSVTRWRAISSGDAQARALAYAYTLAAERDRAHEIALYAITDVDPRNARWALETAAERLGPDQRQALAKAGLLHPQAGVRTQATRQLSADHPETPALLEKRLFDTAQSTRSVAAYLLRTRHGIDPLAVWRSALDQGPSAQARVALQGLADHAQPEDAQRVLPWMQHRAGAMRATALRALIRSGTPEALEHLPAALVDPSLQVQRQALVLYRHLPGMLRVDTLDAAFRSTTSEPTRSTLAHASSYLDRWTALTLLLRWWEQAPDSLAIRHEVAHWTEGRASQATPLPAALRAQLEALLDETHRLTIAQRAAIVHAMKYA
ncbi:MAG: HEAT repeat domain-containing protein [Lysobacter sp.]|nr:HEAT repeat domain-containing protein [Lysobacter sp.]